MSKLHSKVFCRFLPCSEGFSPAPSAATHPAHCPQAADRSAAADAALVCLPPHPLLCLLSPSQRHMKTRWSQEGLLEILSLVPRDCPWFGQWVGEHAPYEQARCRWLCVRRFGGNFRIEAACSLDFGLWVVITGNTQTLSLVTGKWRKNRCNWDV